MTAIDAPPAVLRAKKEYVAARGREIAAASRRAAALGREYVLAEDEWLEAAKVTDQAMYKLERLLGKCESCERNTRHLTEDGKILSICMACTHTEAMLRGAA